MLTKDPLCHLLDLVFGHAYSLAWPTPLRTAPPPIGLTFLAWPGFYSDWIWCARCPEHRDSGATEVFSLILRFNAMVE